MRWEWSWESRPLAQPWHSILLAAFAIALLAVSAWSYQDTRAFVASAHRATGVVVDVIQEKELFHPRVRFVDSAGRRHEFESKLETHPPAFSVGQSVPVLYRPDSPDEAQIEGFFELWFVPLVTFIIGIALAIAAACAWIWREKLFR
jgi:cytochrome b561